MALHALILVRPILVCTHLQAAGAGAFVAALVTEIRFKKLSQLQTTIIEATSDNVNNQDDIFVKTEATAGLVFATTGVAALIGFVALVGRIFNAKHDPTNHRVFTALVSAYWHAWQSCEYL